MHFSICIDKSSKRCRQQSVSCDDLQDNKPIWCFPNLSITSKEIWKLWCLCLRIVVPASELQEPPLCGWIELSVVLRTLKWIVLGPKTMLVPGSVKFEFVLLLIDYSAQCCLVQARLFFGNSIFRPSIL